MPSQNEKKFKLTHTYTCVCICSSARTPTFVHTFIQYTRTFKLFMLYNRWQEVEEYQEVKERTIDKTKRPHS